LLVPQLVEECDGEVSHVLELRGALRICEGVPRDKCMEVCEAVESERRVEVGDSSEPWSLPLVPLLQVGMQQREERALALHRALVLLRRFAGPEGEQRPPSGIRLKLRSA